MRAGGARGDASSRGGTALDGSPRTATTRDSLRRLDRPRLDHRRLHRPDGGLGLRPGPDRRRRCRWPASRAGAFLGSRLGPLLLERGSHSPYAPLFALVGALMLGGGLRLGARGARLPAAPPAAASELGVLGRRRRRRCWWPASGSFLVWIAGAVALQTPGARELREPIQRSAILQRAERGAAAVRADPAGARALRPVPADPRARRERAAAELEDRARPRGAGGRAQRGEGARHRLRPRASRAAAGSAGDGIVVTNAHVVAGPGRHDRPARRRGPAAGRRGRLVRPAATTSRSCACPGSAGAPRAARSHVNAKPGTSAAVLGFPENGPLRRAARRGSARPRPCSPRTPTGAGRCSARSPRCAASCATGNSGGPVVDGVGPRGGHDLRRRHESAAAAGYGVPDSIVRERARPRARRRSTPAPARS